MKIEHLFLVVLLLLFAAPIFAQEPEGPDHFIWLGGGIDGQALTDMPAFIVGGGSRLNENSYIMMNVFTTTDASNPEGKTLSTVSPTWLQVITRQGPTTFFALGEVGFEASAGATSLNVGGGLGVNISLEFLSPKLKNIGLIGAVKLLKDNDRFDEAGNQISNAVKPRYDAGISWSFGK